MRFLLVDDDQGVLNVVCAILTAQGHHVDSCTNARDGIEIATKGDYDFVLVDYKMPENDGIWFMSNAKLPRKTKALLMTAYVNRDVINRMFELGASGYLIKPFDREDLLHHIDFFAQARVGSSTTAG